MSNPHSRHGTGCDDVPQCMDLLPASSLADLTARPVLLSWPCRDTYSGSLYPLPPGLSRREVFCSQCTASMCLFGGTPSERRLGRSARTWLMLTEHDLDEYIAALRLYCDLLIQQRTCWYCANLQRLRSPEPRFVCIHNTHLLSIPAKPGEELPALSAGEAKLLTSLEACAEAHFRRRTSARALIPPGVWRERLVGGGDGACCADCLHLRSVVLAGRQRYLCALEAHAGTGTANWRLARSWRVVQTRRGHEVWCRGSLWCPRLGEVVPLSAGEATA